MSDNNLVYTEKVDLPSGAWVELRSMKTTEMDILSSKKEMKDGKGINTIAKNCIVSSSEGFNYDNALQGDRYSIIVNIRRISYGADYEFKQQCPQCDENGFYKVDLSDLPVRYLDGRPTTNLEFILPRAKRLVKFHLPTGKDEEEIMKFNKKQESGLMTTALMVYTDSVEGEQFKNKEFFKNIDALDVVAFQDAVDEANCGVETNIDLCCPHCSYDFETELPITRDFFLPKGRKKP